MDEFMSLKARKILVVDTPKGYMQVLEYTLQDNKYLYVVQWHYSKYEDLGILCNSETFYDCKDKVFEFAENIGNDLLHQD